jgi:hypothetical protein
MKDLFTEYCRSIQKPVGDNDDVFGFGWWKDKMKKTNVKNVDWYMPK